MIKQVKNKEQLNICLEIIRNNFITVADEFGLTENNCPSHTAFMTIEFIRNCVYRQEQKNA